MIAINCNGLSFLIFEEKWSNYTSGPKSAPNSDSFWVRRLFEVCVLVFCAPNATILLVYIPARIKMSFFLKDNFFLPKSASSVNRSPAHLAKRIHTHIRSAFCMRRLFNVCVLVFCAPNATTLLVYMPAPRSK